MNWSWRLGRISGIDVYMHWTFLLLLAWVGYQYYLARPSLGYVLLGLVSILGLFVIIVLHELGHALAARRYGIATRDITLLPIGGLARLERMPDDPWQELVVALAGPLVNVVMAVALFIGIQIAGEVYHIEVMAKPGTAWLGQLMWVNVILAAFNMLPAFPMDGGRVLRALLALRMDYVKATALAASIGQGMAVFLGFLGLFYNPMLLFIAFFVWLGAESEANLVQTGSVLAGIPVQNAMVTRFQTLRADETLAEAVATVQGGFQHDFPVVEGETLVGLMPRDLLLAAVAEKPGTTPIQAVMERDFVTVDPRDMLNKAKNLFTNGDADVLPVVRQGRLCGLVTPDSLGRFLVLRNAALRARPQSA